MATTSDPLVRTDPPKAPSRRKHTREEMLAIFRAAREEFQAANPTGRDPVEELIAERRAAAAAND